MPYKRQFYDPIIETPPPSPDEHEPVEVAAISVPVGGVYLRVEDVVGWLRQQALEAHSQQRSGPWREALEASADALEQAVR